MAEMGYNSVGSLVNAGKVVAGDTHLDRVLFLTVRQVLYLDNALGEVVGVLLLSLTDDVLGIVDTGCIDDELGEVVARNLRSVGRLESGRRHSVEVCHGDNPRIFPQHVLQRVGELSCSSHGSTRRHEYLDGELVALGYWHELLRQADEQQRTKDDGHHGNSQHGSMVGKALLDSPVVEPLHVVEQVERLLAVLGYAGLNRFADAIVHQDRQEGLRYNHADEEDNGDSPREHLQEVMHDTRHRDEEREEGYTDAERCREDTLQEVACRLDSTLPSGHARGKVVDIAVDDDYGVVDNHSEGHDEGGKGHGVELKVEDVEQSERDEYRHRHCRGGNGCHLTRHDEHDDKEHGGNGYEQLTKEVENGVVDNLLLVGYLADLDVMRELSLNVG